MNKFGRNEEEWVRWNSDNSQIMGSYIIEQIKYDHEKFRLILKSQVDLQLIEIDFPQTVYSIRITNESAAFELYDWLESKYGKSFYLDWSFFKAKNSEYLNWISNGTYGVSETYNLTHYVISDLELIIDVVTHNDPQLKIIQSK